MNVGKLIKEWLSDISPQRWRELKPMGRREALVAYLFVAPFILGLLIFIIFPMGFSLYMSFTSWDVARPPEWIGLENYAALAEDELVHTAVYNTFFFTVFSVPLGIGVALGLAMLLNQNVRGAGLWRTLFYMPSLVPAVATTLLWVWIFNKDYGIFNAFLGLFNIPHISWLGDPRYIKPSLIIMSLWQSGGGTVIFLAALKSVPQEYYDASQLDGANAWQRFWHITLPLISPALFFMLTTGFIFSLQSFNNVYVLASRPGGVNSPGGPRNTWLFYVLYLYLNAFRYWKMGYASALAWALFVVIVIITLIQFRTVGARVYYETEAGGEKDK